MTTFVELLTKHVDNLQIEGDYASGKIDTDSKYEKFREELKEFGYSFTTRSSRKENYGVDSRKSRDGDEKPDSEGIPITKRKQPGRGSLMYKCSSDVSVPFIGHPFVVETTIYLTCSQGIKYYASKRFPDEMFREGDPLSKKRRRAKTTQKIGCQARMTVKKIIVFMGDEYVVGRDNWREKKAAIDILRNDLLENKNIECITRYCIVISLDTTHNHPPIAKRMPRNRKTVSDPAKRVLKLQETIQETLLLLKTDIVPKCTNILTLQSCCNHLKTLINQMKDSIDRNDGVPREEVDLALEKITQKQSKSAELVDKKLTKKKAKPDESKLVDPLLVKEDDINDNDEDDDNNEENPVKNEQNSVKTVIEIPAVIDGTQVIWDPLNVSWIQDQNVIIDSSHSTDSKPIIVKREDGNIASVISQNVVTQGGQNFTIIHPGQLQPVPFTMSKVVQPTPATIIGTSPAKKVAKKGEVGVAFTLPSGVEWGQQTWGQIAQVVTSDQFQNYPQTTVWNIAQ